MSLVVDSYRFAAAGGGGEITFPITGVAPSYTSTRSPSFTLGTAPATDDILVAFVASSTGAATTDTSGWTNVLGVDGRVATGGVITAIMVYHRVTSAEAGASTVTWTLTNIWDGTETGRICVAVLRGVATTGELVGNANSSSASDVTPLVIADVTPTANDCQIVAGLCADDGGGHPTLTTPTGYTLQAGGEESPQTAVLYSDDTLGTSGVATGTTGVTPSSADPYISIVACFAPA